MHGLTNNAHDFDLVAPYLAERYRVIALDVRGRGDSQWGPPANYNIPTYVSDIDALIDKLGIHRVSLVGNSMGGRIALLYALEHPAKVDRIVMNDIGPSIEAATTERINQHVAKTPADFANLDEVVSYYAADPSMAGLAGHAGPALVDCARFTVKPLPNGRLTWKTDPALRSIAPGQTAIRQLDLWPRLPDLTVPLLIVRGGASDVLPSAMARRMCETAPDARLVEVAGVGHVPSLVEPEALAALREFFAR
jgi:pimeloyl-ACP methyl ester carboxylesterase